jgi:ABC-type Fe3+/spermidine/putrescine transport system ATPase subunit
VGQTNLIRGKVVEHGESLLVQTSFGALRGMPVIDVQPDSNVILSVRPEQMRLVDVASPAGDNRVAGTVRETTFLGEASEHVMAASENAGDLKLIIAPPRFDLDLDQSVVAEFDVKDAVVLPA